MASHLLLSFGPARAALAHTGLRGGSAILGPRLYRLAAEQPTLVALGKRSGSPYTGLALYEIDAAEPAVVVAELLRRAIERGESGAVGRGFCTERHANWLFSPISDVIRRKDPPRGAPHIHLAFTNSTAGRDAEFNRWYSGEHMSHALLADGFATAQRFKLATNQSLDAQLPGADPSPYAYLTLYELRTDDIRASEDDMHQYATGVKPGMPLSSSLGPVRATWVYTPTLS